MLHFCLGSNPTCIQAAGIQSVEVQVEDNQIVVPNFIARTIKMGIYLAAVVFQSWPKILLVPALIRMLTRNVVTIFIVLVTAIFPVLNCPIINQYHDR